MEYAYFLLTRASKFRAEAKRSYFSTHCNTAQIWLLNIRRPCKTQISNPAVYVISCFSERKMAKLRSSPAVSVAVSAIKLCFVINKFNKHNLAEYPLNQSGANTCC